MKTKTELLEEKLANGEVPISAAAQFKDMMAGMVANAKKQICTK